MNIKIINKPSLIAINILIIALTELTGAFFFTSGAIHILAILFVIINISILTKFNVLDEPHIRKIFKTFNLSTLFLASVHVLEYLGNNPLVSTKEELLEVIDTSVIAGYLIFFFTLLYGLRSVVVSYSKATEIKPMPKALILFPILVLAVVVGLFINGSTTVLNNENIVGISFLSATTLFGIIAIAYSNRIIKPLALLKGFIRSYQAGIVFIICSALAELLETIPLSIPLEQITYFSHFFYFIGLSFMIFGTMKLFNLGGMYGELLQTMGVIKDTSTKNQPAQ